MRPLYYHGNRIDYVVFHPNAIIPYINKYGLSNNEVHIAFLDENNDRCKISIIESRY
jgi:hypothetical protein